MKTNNILSIFLAMVLGLVGSLSVAQASVGANPNDYTKKIMLDRFDKVKADIYYASKTTGMDMGDLTAIASIESGLLSNAKHSDKRYTSAGMLGHTSRTWATDRKTYHAVYGVPANAKVSNAKASLLIGAASLVNDKQFIVERTHLTADQIRLGDQYMTHFLGRDMAVRVLNSNSGTPMNKLVRISKANWNMFVKPNGKVRTAREFRSYLNTIAQRERDFYSEEIKTYTAYQRKSEIRQEFHIGNDALIMAQANTAKFIGWGS